jgi:hydroxysqualene dehydroxylase
MSDDVLIIGGGFAGLAAGVALSRAGIRIHLLEQKPYLGGRARSFHYAPTGTVLDNGQHVFMGCYHATIEFLKTIGTLDRVRFQERLAVQFLDRGGVRTSLKLASLPAPWHMVMGAIRSNSFTWPEKLQIARAGRALRSPQSRRPQDEPGRLSVDEWLARLGQSEQLRRNFWDLLCIAALNEDPHIAAAAVFEPVMRLALFQSAQDSRIGFATSGLSVCYTDAAADFIRNRGGKVELGRDVRALLFSSCGREGREGKTICDGVRLSDGAVIRSKTVLSAIPSFALVPLLPANVLRSFPAFAAFSALKPSPIISINFWFDRSVTELDFAGLRGTTIQWLFNKERLHGIPEHVISLVLSGAHEHIHKESRELAALALQELQELLPEARTARLIHSFVLKERWATFSPAVDSLAVRPPAVSPIRGLYLAGDWTQTGLPATIESAVQSGFAAASEVVRAG